MMTSPFKLFVLGLSLTFAGITEGRGQDKMTPQTPPPDKVKPPEEAPIAQTEMSKMLESKLFISSGLGYTTISGSSGTWAAGLAGDFGLGYEFTEDLAGGKGIATFRFVPTDVAVSDDGQSYQGVVQIYNFGTMWQKVMGGTNVVASAELGLMTINLSTTDGTKEKSSLEDGSVNLTLGGGADFEIFEKVKGGPRAYVGFGGATYVQVAGTMSFLF